MRSSTNTNGEAEILAINFHYVHPDGDSYPGLHKRTLEELSHQFDELCRNAQCLSPEQLEDALEGNTDALPKLAFVLTFDDGLKDHIRYVAPELERRGWSAFFFVNTAPWKGELLDVHKLQLLNATVPFSELYHRFLSLVRKECPNLVPDEIPMERIRQQYRYDEDDVARFKFAINFEMPVAVRPRIVSRLFEAFMGREGKYVEELYLSPAECKTLADMGHTIGCHSHRHQALSLMSPDERKEDLSTNIREIHRATGDSPLWISFPYGSKDAVDESVLAECSRQGIRYGFTMQRGFIELDASDTALNRVDTNDAPGGKSPLIDWKTPAEVAG